MTDTDYLLHVLREQPRWVELGEILDRSRHERGHAFTVHSRAADLRKRGHTVLQRSERGPHGRTLSFYRLVLVEAGPPNPRDRSEAPTTDGMARDDRPASTSTPARSPGGATGETAPPLSAVSPAQLSLVPETHRGAYDEEAA